MTQTAAARADRATSTPDDHPGPRSASPRTRRLATGTGATLALAAVAVTATGGAAQADEEYTVRTGDTVSHIAARYGTSVAAVRSSNGLDSRAFIREGQILTIPTQGSTSTGTTTTASSSTATASSHTVTSGETVSAIAATYGTTVAAIVSANGLNSRAFIREGQTLTIPGATGTSTAATTAGSSTATASSHTITSGETVSAIAATYGTTVAAIVSANGLNSRAFIREGQTLTIPGATGTSTAASSTTSSTSLVGSTFAGRTYHPTVVASANQNKAALLAMGVPSTSEMQAKVAATATAMGVDPALAQAVAFQESGFNQTSVSPANAIGTMQVIPSAGDWASQLVGRELNLLDPDDNVVAGIAILRSLVRTSPNLSTAIASYYQGATSVKNNGMYADTRRYVANVQTLMTRY